jgi:hypothetical protein
VLEPPCIHSPGRQCVDRRALHAGNGRLDSAVLQGNHGGIVLDKDRKDGGDLVRDAAKTEGAGDRYAGFGRGKISLKPADILVACFSSNLEMPPRLPKITRLVA